MYIFTLRTIALLTVLITMAFSPHTQAAESMSELVNRSGMQRMLSQRIAKAYFYHGNDVSVKETKLQLDMAIERFKKNHAVLKSNVEDAETKDLLSFVEDNFSEYSDLVYKPYNQENATRVLELSDTLLKACHSVVLNLADQSGDHVDNIINISGKQRMLSQRVSKFYIAYQAGFRDEATVHQLNNTVEEFETGLKKLMSESRNNGEINALLAKSKKEWERISPYFLKVRKGGLPLMVLTATDGITKLANQITLLYEKKAAAK
ncbi:type IV pili methyl-accepting chemotaxis transducer N-terminal domain-containing protein [Desulfobulbus sp. US1]|nr:type IV pili methyl-accepting chemotaxis transducer N-terminal domain-containing protein [Desulfobulbus sp. US4]MCW5208679.1 type IV pili methyl-accepting chemotaxis transducer N-terminal domain-containing protein [Desulfobulbus sp. US1]WLE99216.1 MAG: type IV pili methyl-accepting chemotaxis transducer N-terminal domain-containing protein [Candidatus Electrothrix communis]